MRNSTIQQEMGHFRFLTSTCNSTIVAKLLLVENLQFNNSTENSTCQDFSKSTLVAKLLPVEKLQFNKSTAFGTHTLNFSSFCKWKIINSTNQQRFELIYKTFQAFASGKFAIQQFNGEWCILDIKEICNSQLLQSFCQWKIVNSIVFVTHI